MAHVKHFNKQSVRNIIKEHTRDTDHYKNYVDVSRSKLNFGYGHQTADDMALNIKARCGDIMQGQKMQDQTNVMSEWLVTYPSWLCDKAKGENGRTYYKPRDPKHVKTFFDAVYRFTVERYGEENVMGAYVHMDETTPHMHVDLVPEATSRKTGKKTVSSASLFTKAELKRYQQELQKEMVRVFGKEAGKYILNGRTVGNFTIDELKERTRVKRQQAKREKEVAEKEQAVQEKEQELTVAVLDFIGDITGFEYDPEQTDLDLVMEDLKQFRDELLKREAKVDNLLEKAEDFYSKGEEYMSKAEAVYKQSQEQAEAKRKADAELERVTALREQRRRDKERRQSIDAIMAKWGDTGLTEPVEPSVTFGRQ